MDTLCYTMRGIGLSLLPTVISLTGACLFRIVWIYTVFAAHHTQFVLYISYPISWTLTSVAYVICYLIIRKKKFPKEEPEPLPNA
jgi:Na+-driven multidrug efflux pump